MQLFLFYRAPNILNEDVRRFRFFPLPPALIEIVLRYAEPAGHSTNNAVFRQRSHQQSTTSCGKLGGIGFYLYYARAIVNRRYYIVVVAIIPVATLVRTGEHSPSALPVPTF